MSYYFIGATRFDDYEGMLKYFAGIMPLFAEHRAELIVQGPCEATLEGDFPITSAVVARFADRQAALGWYESGGCQKLKVFRTSIGASNAWLAVPSDPATGAQPAIQPGGEYRYFLGVTRIADPGRLQAYGARIKSTVHEFGGTMVLEARCESQPEGSVPADNVMVIRFNSAADANRWHQSPQYAALRASRTEYAQTALWMMQRAAA